MALLMAQHHAHAPAKDTSIGAARRLNPPDMAPDRGAAGRHGS
jgi:hypothetical protein